MAGIRWYFTAHAYTQYVSWETILKDGDKATVWHSGDGCWGMRRSLSPRAGENYTITANRYGGDNDMQVTRFEEAAAIALSLPSFLAVLGDKAHSLGRD